MNKLVSTLAALSLIGGVGVTAFAVDGNHSDEDHGQFSHSQGDISNAKKGSYTVDPLHSYISFSYNHLGFSYPVLGFTKFDASLQINPKKLDETRVDVTIDADSIDSRIAVFDGHLKNENFFDVANHPEITFVSTAALPASNGNGKIAGDLTIKGITKPVVLDVVLHNAGKHAVTKKPSIGVSAKTTIKRSEWDLGLYAPNVSDEVEVTITAEFTKN